jgi:hypothetical protein
MARNDKKKKPEVLPGSTGRAPRSGGGSTPPPAPPDLRVQLPYFAARIAALIVVLVVLLCFDLNPVFAVLSALVITGVLTYPIGRMQRRAAERAAGRLRS